MQIRPTTVPIHQNVFRFDFNVIASATPYVRRKQVIAPIFEACVQLRHIVHSNCENSVTTTNPKANV